MKRWMAAAFLFGWLVTGTVGDPLGTSVGYATGLVSGNGFCLSLPAGTGQVQVVAGGFYVKGSSFNSYSVGLDYKLPVAQFELSQDATLRLFGVAGGSVFTGANINWIGYGQLYIPALTASLASYALVAELDGISGSLTPSIAVGVGFGLDLGLMRLVHFTLEPVLAGAERFEGGSVPRLRLGFQSAVLFEL